MKLIPLTQGKVAIVSDEDYEHLCTFKWHADKKGLTFYAARSLKREKGKPRQQVYMHQSVAGSKRIDHRDGNGLNNQRDNLRACSQMHNSRNRVGTVHTSPFKGVCWATEKKKWKAYIRVNYQRINLGYYIDPTLAAIAYDLSAMQHFGEFAKTNVLKRGFL